MITALLQVIVVAYSGSVALLPAGTHQLIFEFSRGPSLFGRAPYFVLDGVSGQVTELAVSGAIPEPATWAMMLIGFGAVGYSMRRRPQARAQLV